MATTPQQEDEEMLMFNEQQTLLHQIMSTAPIRLRYRRRNNNSATSNRTEIVLPANQQIASIPPPLPPVLHGCILAVANCEQVVRQSVLHSAQQYASQIRDTFTSECTHLITPVQHGAEYEQALMEQKIIANVHWLEDVIANKVYFAPFKPLVHFPVPNLHGIDEMKNLVISVTGFVGEERNDLKQLIRMSGANYSGTLSKKENTHLICCTPEGEKYKKAMEWSITVVSKRWLHDCVKYWKRVPEHLYQDICVNR